MILFSLVALTAAAAHASPRLDVCLPVAPKACALTAASAPDEYFRCFEGFEFRTTKDPEVLCAGELLHAKVHRACDATDIPTVCAGVEPGNDRVMTCLRKHRKTLTGPCRDALRRFDGWNRRTSPKRRRGGAVSAVRC